MTVLIYRAAYADNANVLFSVDVGKNLKSADDLAYLAAAERSAANLEYVELVTDHVGLSEHIWQSGEGFGFFDETGLPSDIYASRKDAEQALHDYGIALGAIADQDDTVDLDTKLLWQLTAGATAICLAIAWLVVHLTDYVWWFPVGMTAYTLAGLPCYWAMDRILDRRINKENF